MSENYGAYTNWDNFASRHVHTWQGHWTRYSAQGQVIQDFPSRRDFRFGSESQTLPGTQISPGELPTRRGRGAEDRNVVIQENTYFQKDGPVKQAWTLERKSNCLADGIFHPQAASQRALFLPSIATWSRQTLPCGPEAESYGMEIFCLHQAVRFSVGLIFTGGGDLQRLALVREYSRQEDAGFWTENIEQQALILPTGTYEGYELSVNSKLS